VKKVTIRKSSSVNNLESRRNFDRLQERLLCQFEIPGVGRLRTGERHSDFHITDFGKPARIEKTIDKDKV